MKIRSVILSFIAACLTVGLGAQQSFTGTSYQQNFDGLPSSGTFALVGSGPHALSAAPINASGMTGWSLAKYTGSGTNAAFLVGTGSANNGAAYSYGSASSSDRALGSVGSGSVSSRFGLVLVNDSGSAITSFTVSYTGEQWRRGSAAANKLTFSYGVGATDINTGTFFNVTDLDFTAPNTTGTSIAIDGNAAGNRTAISFEVTGVNWGTGQTLVLRWTDVDDTGSDDGVAIDDLTFAISSGPPPPPPELTPISSIQGSGLTSPLAGQAVEIVGVVTASFQGTNQLGGYYVQSLPEDVDADPLTSEGIFVFDLTTAVTAGDHVSITGTVIEYGSSPNTVTELTAITDVTILGSAPLPDPVAVTLPLTGAAELEAFEGMRVMLPQTLTVTNNYTLGRFGEFTVANGRLQNPTNFVLPGAPAQALSATNQLNQLLVNDNSNIQNPDPTPYFENSGGQGVTRRTGSLATGLTGVIDNKFGAYVLEPTSPIVFVDDNPRAVPPTVGGTLKIVGGNVLNLFNGNGAGGGFPTARGASNLTEYGRQQDKIVAGLTAIGADIYGLTEVENDGHGPESAIAQFVDALNAAAPAGTTYAFVNTGGVDTTTDAIRNVFVYRTETVEPVGVPASLDNQYFFGLARSPVAQTFRQISNGELLTVCINHFRAKASAASSAASNDGISPNPNLDQLDGQGTNNYLRVREAETLAAWLATDPTGSGDPDFLIIGDLNTYSMEDPITALVTAGYIDLQDAFEGPGGYSYQFAGEFGHLDHALATEHLALQTMGTAVWHANADEPVSLDYNLEFKSANLQALNIGTPYRYSDHDPVIIGLDLEPDPTLPAFTEQPQSQAASFGGSVTFTVAATGYPAPTFQWCKDGAPINGETFTSLTLSSLTFADEGSYTAKATNIVGTVESDPAVLTVVDLLAPTINSISATPNLLGSPNHKMIPVAVTAVATDNADPAPVCRIISVTSSESANGLGDGNTAVDWQITGDLTLNLRAERSGKGNDRIYTITVECSDFSGNASTGTTNVIVKKGN